MCLMNSIIIVNLKLIYILISATTNKAIKRLTNTYKTLTTLTTLARLLNHGVLLPASRLPPVAPAGLAPYGRAAADAAAGTAADTTDPDWGCSSPSKHDELLPDCLYGTAGAAETRCGDA